ncbi:MAG: carbohydrate porin [Bacteroidales bacterium]
MKRLPVLFLIICLVIQLPARPLQAQDSLSRQDEAVRLEASYVGDMIYNLHGGLRTGATYLGMANLCLGFDTENAGFWKGGTLYLKAANTHGGQPSAMLLGDIQGASNIEAGEHTYIQELWFRQTVGQFELTLGLQDLNAECAGTCTGAFFLNSSFGILPTISGNFNAPIFPLTAPGLTVKWKVGESVSLVNAIYDGTPTDFSSNPYNLRWPLNAGDGIMTVTEYQQAVRIQALPGMLRFGLVTHSHLVEKSLGEEIPDSLDHDVLSLYAIADQQLWVQGERAVGFFTQLGYSPTIPQTNRVYLGMGLSFAGPIPSRTGDVAGLALAHARCAVTARNETAIELSYRIRLHEKFSLQPDLQYIIRPAGTAEVLDNALAAFLRCSINF